MEYMAWEADNPSHLPPSMFTVWPDQHNQSLQSLPQFFFFFNSILRKHPYTYVNYSADLH